MVTIPKLRAMEESVKSLEERCAQLSDMMRKIKVKNISLGLKMEEQMAHQA